MVQTIIPRGQTHSLQVTLCLLSEEWPRVGNSPGLAIRDSHSLRADSFSLGYTLFSVGGMAQGEEWSKHFLGKVHSLQVTPCLVSKEWPRVRNGLGSEIRNNISSLFVKNRVDSPLLMRTDILSDLTNVSERSPQRIQFIFNSIFYAG
jgi:hypothetical protein